MLSIRPQVDGGLMKRIFIRMRTGTDWQRLLAKRTPHWKKVKYGEDRFNTWWHGFMGSDPPVELGSDPGSGPEADPGTLN